MCSSTARRNASLLYSTGTGRASLILVTSSLAVGGGTHPENEALKEAVLSGNFGTLSTGSTDEEKEKLEVARAWDATLASLSATRPSSVGGIHQLENLRMMEGLLCPFRLSNEVMLKRTPAEALEKHRKEIEAKLLAILEGCGF